MSPSARVYARHTDLFRYTEAPDERVIIVGDTHGMNASLQ